MATKTGTITVNEKLVLEVSSNPAAGAGTPADPGSVAMFDNAGSGEFYLKTGAADTAWSLLITATIADSDDGDAWYIIPLGTTKTVFENIESNVLQRVTIDGSLVVNGRKSIINDIPHLGEDDGDAWFKIPLGKSQTVNENIESNVVGSFQLDGRLVINGRKTIINDTQNNLGFGNSFSTSSSEGVSTTASATFQNKLSHNTGTVPAGRYRADFTFELSHTAAAGDESEAEVQINGVQVNLEHQSENLNDNDIHGGFFDFAVATASQQNIRINFRSVNATASAQIQRARINFYRVA